MGTWFWKATKITGILPTARVPGTSLPKECQAASLAWKDASVCCVKVVGCRKRPGGCFRSLQEMMGCEPGSSNSLEKGARCYGSAPPLTEPRISNVASPILLGEMRVKPANLMTSLTMKPGTSGALRHVCPIPRALYKRGGDLQPQWRQARNSSLLLFLGQCQTQRPCS